MLKNEKTSRAGSTHSSSRQGFNIAFTLAETLITLAIIGVVAVMVIPTLVKNYKTRAWNIASKVFEIKIEQALKVMNTQQTLVGYRTTRDFLGEFSKHMKITMICDTVTDCMEEKVIWNDEEVDMSEIKTALDFGQEDWDTEVLGVQFANGTIGAIAYNPTSTCRQDPYSNRINGSSCIALLYDTSGFQSPNTSGKDLRAINLNKLGQVCAFEIGGTCYGTPFEPAQLLYTDCLARKDALGINECGLDGSSPDFWGGAVASCKGVKNIPTKEQVAQIASKIYNTPVSSGSTTYGTRNDEIASSLGFRVQSGELFGVFSREEFDNMRAGAQVFFPDSVTPLSVILNNDPRRAAGWQAVCIIK